MEDFKYTVLLDNGHGWDTLGKFSPKINFIDITPFNHDFIIDQRFKEYAFARKVVKEAIPMLKGIGINAIEVVPEKEDVPLKERVRRINNFCKEYPNCIMISNHTNAAGNGDTWMDARGFSVWTTKGQNNSDKLADCVYEAADNYMFNNINFKDSFDYGPQKKMIREEKSDGDRDYESNFYIIKNSNCPSILIEYLFHDNKRDVELMCNEHCFYQLVATMVYGANNFFVKYKGKEGYV